MNENAQANDEKRQRRRNSSRLAEHLGSHIHLAAGGAFLLLGLILPDFLRTGTGLSVAGVARGL